MVDELFERIWVRLGERPSPLTDHWREREREAN